MLTYNIVTELRCTRVKGYKELTKNLGKLRFFVQKVKEDLKNGKKTREKHMFCEDFGSRRNGSLGEAGRCRLGATDVATVAARAALNA